MALVRWSRGCTGDHVLMLNNHQCAGRDDLYARLFCNNCHILHTSGNTINSLGWELSSTCWTSAFRFALVIDWRTTGEYQSSQLFTGTLLWIMWRGVMWTMIITYYVSHSSHERLLMDRQFPSTPGTYSPVSMKKIYTVGGNYVYCCTPDYFFTLGMHLVVDMTISHVT